MFQLGSQLFDLDFLFFFLERFLQLRDLVCSTLCKRLRIFKFSGGISLRVFKASGGNVRRFLKCLGVTPLNILESADRTEIIGNVTRKNSIK